MKALVLAFKSFKTYKYKDKKITVVVVNLKRQETVLSAFLIVNVLKTGKKIVASDFTRENLVLAADLTIFCS